MSDEFQTALATGDADAAQKLWDGEKPAPAVEKPAVEKTDAPIPSQEDAGRARNADGTFAPRGTSDAKAEPAEPFEGFKDLSPAAQAQFNRLRGEADDFRLRYTRLNGEYRRLSRQGSGQAQPSRNPSSGTTQAGQAARQAAARVAPGTGQNAAVRQIEKWEAHAKAYPDEAAAVTELLDAYANQLEQGLNPIQQEIAQLRSQVGDLDEIRAAHKAMQSERDLRVAYESQQELSKVGGDNWRQIAGWEDDNGNPIPPDKRDWHPEFRAWVEGHDPDEQDHLWQTLAHSSPKVAGSVFRSFNRDRFALENTNAQATPGSSVQDKRREALRDVQPGASRTGIAAPAQFQPTGDAYADAIRAGYAAWQKA